MTVQITEVEAGYNLTHNIADHRIIIHYKGSRDGKVVIYPEWYIEQAGKFGWAIDTESMGKEFFLDLMSKLYDMAEVK